MQFVELARSFDADVDKTAKRPKFKIVCPAGCGGTLLVKDFGEDKPVLICDRKCSDDAIWSAIENTQARSDPAAQTRETAGEDLPHPSPATPLASQPRALSTVRSTGVDNSLRQVPPQNIEAEQAVLGAVFLDPESLVVARQTISVADFYQERHRIIFQAMCDLAGAGRPIDVLTMRQALKTKGKLEEIGIDYIGVLADAVPTTAHQKHYAEIVRDMAVKRAVATITADLSHMAYNGVSADALVGEFQRRAQSLDTVKSNAVNEIFNAKIQPFTGKDLSRRAKLNPVNRTVCDGFLLRKQVSMWAGKVEAGKTTLLRELAMDVIRGDPFLGRACAIGRVTYLMLDADGEDLTYQEFLKMGWDPETEDNLEFIFDPIFAQKPRALDQFHQYLLERQPSLVVIDPLGRFIKADDFNSYGMTYVMAVISELAKETDCHFAVPQHIPRGRNDDADTATAAFGSIAIGGSVNARFVCTHKPGNIYTLKTSRGKGAGFVPLEEELILTREESTGRITAQGAYSWKDQAKALMDQVQRIVDGSEDPLTAQEIAQQAGIMRSAAGSAAQMLYAEKRPEFRRIDREGKGKAGSPFKFKKLTQLSMSNGNAPEN